MNPESIFSAGGMVAMAGWLMLIVAPRARWSLNTVRALPIVLSSVYTVIVILHWGEASGGFSNLADVAQLFTNRWLLLAGWIHYLAFDLFVGIWEVQDSVQHKIPHVLVIPCLLLTFLFGPAGLLIYCVLRIARRKSVSHNLPH
jgi:hypothetical protein